MGGGGWWRWWWWWWRRGVAIANRRRPATPVRSGCAAIISSLFRGSFVYIFFLVVGG